MKRLFFRMMTVAAVAATTLTACGSDNDDNQVVVPGSSIVVDGNILKGRLTGRQTLESKEYILDGTVIIAEGGELTIPAGTTIKANKGFSNYLLVAQGGKLNANGTATAPVTFTANGTAVSAGYWGGVIINGRAPISGTSTDQSDTSKTEVDNTFSYGGNVPNDNSGSLTYVNIFYAGARSTSDIEHNGLTLNGVGSGTKIENIYVLESADDAIEFFGGTVNVTNLLAVNPDDDMFDFTQGYSGTLKNCYGIWETGYSSTEADPRGVEADGNLDGTGPTHQNQSVFRIEGMTIVSNTADDNETQGTKNRMDDVIKVRRGAKATISNVLVAGTGGAKDLVDVTDSKGAGTADTTIGLTLASTFTVHGKEKNGECNLTLSTTNTGADTSALSWTSYKFPTLNK